jgi:hypothetical protein
VQACQKVYGLSEEVGDEGSFYLNPIYSTKPSKWVKYEIEQSIERGNGILTIDISKIADLKGNTTDCCSLRVPGTTHYLWNNGNGRENIGKWVEAAAKTAGK